VGLLALGLAGLCFSSWWRRRPARHLAEARRLIEANRPDEAADWLRLPEAEATTRDRALLLRVQAAVAQARPAEAVKAIEKINPRGPLAADVALWKGRILFQVRQVSRAVHWLREALTLRGDDPETLRWLAAALYELGDHPSAVAALDRLTQLAPDDARAWRTLGLLNKENREFEAARLAYARALQLDTRQPLVRFELAETLVEMGQHVLAEEELARCRGGVSEPDRLALQLQCRLQLTGDTEVFRESLAASLAEFPDHPGLIAYRAQVDLIDGRIAAALDGFNRVLAANPCHAQAFYQRGLANHRLGRTDEAVRDLSRARELNAKVALMARLNRESAKRPEDAGVRCQLGEVSAALGKPELAASWYMAALACDPRHPGAVRGLKALGREDLIRHPARQLPTALAGSGR
jgi:tetratricopeptide (TPR) repeat protein